MKKKYIIGIGLFIVAAIFVGCGQKLKDAAPEVIGEFQTALNNNDAAAVQAVVSSTKTALISDYYIGVITVGGTTDYEFDTPYDVSGTGATGSCSSTTSQIVSGTAVNTQVSKFDFIREGGLFSGEWKILSWKYDYTADGNPDIVFQPKI